MNTPLNCPAMLRALADIAADHLMVGVALKKGVITDISFYFHDSIDEAAMRRDLAVAYAKHGGGDGAFLLEPQP